MPLDVTLDPARTALLVIDMQNDFCSSDGFFDRVGLDLTPGRTIVPRIATLLEALRRRSVFVVFTKSARRDPQPQAIRPSRPFYRQPGEGEQPFAPGSWGSE